MIHAASLDTSPRLQRVYSLLRKGAEYSTRDIIQRANVCAVNTIAAELKACGGWELLPVITGIHQKRVRAML